MASTFRLVHQDFAHHLPPETPAPVDKVGPWNVYALDAVPYGWPGNGTRLAVEESTAGIEYLRARFPDAPPVDPQPLPVPPDPEAP